MTAGVDLSHLPVADSRRIAARVTKDAARHIRSGHPWIFDSSITSLSHEGAAGDLAVVFDERRKFMAIGLFDPDSPIRIRVLHHGDPATIDRSWWRARRDAALELRRGLAESAHASDEPTTDGYRIVNGENDGFGGLVIDRFASTYVIKIYTPAWFPHLNDVLAAFDETIAEPSPEPPNVIVRLARSVAAAETYGLVDGAALRGITPNEPVLFRENGLTFEADVVHGQKTGAFLDQRDKRQMVRELSRGADVLDVFSCTGGFSVHAAAGGATSVTSVDIARHAIDAAIRNMAHNLGDPGVAACVHHTSVGDAFEVMARLADDGRTFGVVVIDPPSFAQKQVNADGALRAYGRLTAAGLRLVEPGGLLVQASCSSRVSADDFFDTVTRAADAQGARLTEVARTTHGVDHPVTFREGAYLKALFARVGR